MRYLLLIYGNDANWEHPLFLSDPAFRALPPGRRDELTREWETLRRELADSGELIEGVGLGAPATTRTVRVRDGAATTTDGPYIETKEHLAGYLLVDCRTPERAAELAARIPDAHLHAVEIRPITSTN